MEIAKEVILLVVGFVLLIKGADFFVEGASKIADRFHIPQIIIGLTIVALGTSAPEAAVSIASARGGSADITIGNVLGSNLLNVLLILGITSTICALSIQKSTLRVEMPFVIILSVLLVFLGMNDGKISRFDGIILYVLLISFIAYLIIMALKGNPPAEEGDFKQKPVIILILMTILGMIAIIFGADITVDAATSLAKIFGMSERLIGLTIIALGTSLPELITSVTAALKGKADIAIGNIVGSNIFNILFVVGTTALIIDVPFDKAFLLDGILGVVAASMLLLFSLRKSKLTRPGGLVMLATYIGYLVYLIIG